MERLSNWNGNAQCPKWFFFSQWIAFEHKWNVTSNYQVNMVCLSVIEERARPTIPLDDIEYVWASRRENSNCDQKYECSVNIRVEHASRESKLISTNTRITGIKTHIVYLFVFYFLSLVLAQSNSEPKDVSVRSRVAIEQCVRACVGCHIFKAKDISLFIFFHFVLFSVSYIVLMTLATRYCVMQVDVCWLLFFFCFTTFTLSLCSYCVLCEK